jgi:hypothetical protein
MGRGTTTKKMRQRRGKNEKKAREQRQAEATRRERKG